MNNSRNWRVWVLGIVLGVSTLWVPSVASAKRLSIVCRPAEEGTIILDGMLRDWEDVSRVSVRGAQTVIRGRKHWNDTKDASFEVLCNYSKKTLYLAVDVRDEYFHCSRRRRADDHLDLRFGSKVLKVFPGDLKKIRGVVRWGRKKAKCVRMAEAKKLGGWSVELALPLAKVPGYRAGREAIPLTINFVDADWRGKVDSVISSGPARLVMAQVAAEFKTFLADMKVTSKDVRWHASADVVGDKGLERVLLFHKRVGIVGAGLPRGGYFYFDLPVKAARDIRWVKLMDLNGDRQKEIVIRYLQRGSGGRRGVVA
ncbi:MAG: hypothetical protein KAI47_27445, partial [Deltaproteobacteria bacterium]|nr:hypothetical protein [Deltaproteobacteria bacterium]